MITSSTAPVLDYEVANKKYVDDEVAGVAVVETDPYSLHLDKPETQQFTDGVMTGTGVMYTTCGIPGIIQGLTQLVTIPDIDGVNYHHMTYTQGILTNYVLDANP